MITALRVAASLVLAVSGGCANADEAEQAATSNNTAAASATEPPSDWAFATSAEVIGLNPAFVEKRLGPAKSKSSDGGGALWAFEIGRCTVIYRVADSAIETATIPLTDACVPALTGVAGLDAIDWARTRTFGAATAKLSGSWRADCMGPCGNASAGVRMFYSPGSRASGGQEFALETDVTDDVVEANWTWTTALEREAGVASGEEIEPRLYACGIGAQGVAATAMKNVRIERVRFGYGLDPAAGQDCAAPARAAAVVAPIGTTAFAKLLVGTWSYAPTCETDDGVIYGADGSFEGLLGGSGTWRVEGGTLVETHLTEMDDEAVEPVDKPIRPRTYRASILHIDRTKAQLVNADGERFTMVRCR